MHYKMDDFNFEGKVVLVRAGFDVPFDDDGNITDSSRIIKCIPTFNMILEKGGKLVILSHNGRPKGVEKKLDMASIAEFLSTTLKKHIIKADDCIGSEVESLISSIKKDEVILLENVRFHDEETSKDENARTGFAKKLASLADLYVNESFAVSHRSHASMAGIPLFIPGCSGLLLEKELSYCNLDEPQMPFTMILGGAKADKIRVIENILPKADHILLGGILANTFLKVKGIDIKGSRYDEDSLEAAKELLCEKIILPIDCVCAEEFSSDAKSKICDLDDIPEGWLILDIGPKTISMYEEILKGSNTIVWGGPIGVFEYEQFSEGTKKIAECIAEVDAKKIIGGGDSAAAIAKFRLEDKMTHVSTGGGASLALMGGKKLPAVDALEESYKRFNNL